MTQLDDGTYTAVIDRFEADQAVLLVENEEDSPHVELVVDRGMLPEAGKHVDAVLTVELKAGELHDTIYEEVETEKRTKQVRDRFSKLSERLSDEEDVD